MKSIKSATIILLILLQLIIWGCSKAPLPTDEDSDNNIPKVTFGKIIISSTDFEGQIVDSASVYWDSELFGYTPLTNEKVLPGIHALRVQKKGYEIYSESIAIEAAKSVYVEALLKKFPLNKGQLLITVDQDSATTVLTNSKNDVIDLFYTREKSFILDPGGYFLKTEKPEYKLVHKAFEIKMDSIEIQNIHLEKLNNFEMPEIILVIPDSGYVNEPVLISWESIRADHVDIDYVENPGLSGKREIVFQTEGMRYIRAIVRNNAGMNSVVDSVYISNAGLSPLNPPSLEFVALPESVEYEQPVQISWNSNGYQVIIDQGIGIRGPAGTEEVIFENPGAKIFTAVAYGQNGTTTIKRDTVLIKDPEQPKLPIIILATADSVQVGMPASIEWHSQNAHKVDVDYVQNPGLNGKAEVIFYSEGQRIITATAYNQAGQVTIAETLAVVTTQLPPQVMPIIIEANAKIGAIHPGLPQGIDNIGPAEIKHQGYYRVTATVWYNSGDDQKNESFFVVINDKFNRKIYPQDANAGIYKVVPDDPGPPHTVDRDVGVFYLDVGQITMEVHHYYTIANQYPQFIVDGPIDGAESIIVISFKLEYYHP